MNQITIFRDQYEVKIILIWQFSEYLSVLMDAREGLWCGFLCGSGWQDLAWHPLHWILPRTDHGVLVSLSQVKWKTRGIRRRNRDSPWFFEPSCVWCCCMVLFYGMYWNFFLELWLFMRLVIKQQSSSFQEIFVILCSTERHIGCSELDAFWIMNFCIFCSFSVQNHLERHLSRFLWKTSHMVEIFSIHQVVIFLMNDMIRYFVILIWSIFSLISLYWFLHIFGLKDFWVYFGCWSDFC